MKSLLLAVAVFSSPQEPLQTEPLGPLAPPTGGILSPTPPVVLDTPMRVSLPTKRDVVVSDRGLRQVLTYRRNKRRGLLLSSKLQLGYRPLAADHWQDRTYVGNPDAGCVDVFDKWGVKAGELGGSGGSFQQPNDIVIDRSQSLIYVVDPVLALVKVFDVSSSLEGTLQRTIPPGGPDPFLLTEPTALCLDPGRDELLVSDFGDPVLGITPGVRFFNSSGAQVHFLSGKSGMLGNRFSRPQGLAFDSDVVFVVGSWVGQVFAFDRDTGIQKGSYGTYGTSPGELALPLDVAVDPATKDVYVTNSRNGRLDIFLGGGVVQ